MTTEKEIELEKGCGKFFGTAALSLKCGEYIFGNFILCPECQEKLKLLEEILK
jgi:hypothetical protein